MRLLDIIDLLNDHAVLPQEVDGFDEYAAFGLDEYGERAEGLALDVVDSAAEDVEVEVEAARAFGNDGARDFVAREGEAKQVDCVAVGWFSRALRKRSRMEAGMSRAITLPIRAFVVSCCGDMKMSTTLPCSTILP